MGFSYYSVRFIEVHNTKLALLYYILMLAIWAYVIAFQIVLHKNYQLWDVLTGEITVKIKGSIEDLNSSVYDSYDLILPPTEADAFFVTTSFIQTNQKRSFCTGIKKCSNASDCQTGMDSNFTQYGRLTHRCLNGYCQIKGWCPPQYNDEIEDLKMMGTDLGLWTAFIKANILFPKFGIRLSNAKTKLEKGLNLFTINDFLIHAGTTYDEVARNGTIILCAIHYHCDFDYGIDQCKPTFTLDKLANGFHYRYIKSRKVNSRLLKKVYGIRVIFFLHGHGGKFNIQTLTIALGAGVGFLGISKVICDFILEYVMSRRKKYVAKKYKPVEDQDMVSFSDDYEQINNFRDRIQS